MKGTFISITDKFRIVRLLTSIDIIQYVREEIAASLEEFTAWRRDFHAHPELGFEVHLERSPPFVDCRAYNNVDVITRVTGNAKRIICA